MLKSCQYCGRIHDSKYICPQKAQAIKKRQSQRFGDGKKVSDFRGSRKWTDKSLRIRQRDHGCCQICARGLHHPARRYEVADLSVHHIIPIAEDWARRLDDDVLITLCGRHHEMAECGEISRDELLRIAAEQERDDDYEPC